MKLIHVMRRLVNKEWGGIETSVVALSNELESQGIENPIFTTAMSTKAGKEQMGRSMIHRFSSTLPWLFLKKDEKEAFQRKGASPISLRLFLALLFEKGLTHIHAHSLHRIGGLVRRVAKLRGIPYIVTLHSGYFTIPEEQRNLLQSTFKKRYEWGKWLDWFFQEEKILQEADAIICVNKEEYRICKEKMPEKQIFYLPHGVDRSLFSPKDLPRKKKILSVARFDPQKNQLGLIQAFYEFRKLHPDYTLELIGSITNRAYYNEILIEIKKLDLEEKVHIIPGLPSADPKLLSAYNEADFFVLPSLHEPFGIVILEAWAMKCPVIAAKVGGIPGFAEDGKTALLFQTKEELLEKMCALATSEVIKDELRSEAFTAVEKYSWRQISDQLLAIYKSL